MNGPTDAEFCQVCLLDLVAGRCPVCDVAGRRRARDGRGESALARHASTYAAAHPGFDTTVTVVTVLVVGVLALALIVAAAPAAFVIGAGLGGGGVYVALRTWPAMLNVAPEATTDHQPDPELDDNDGLPL